VGILAGLGTSADPRDPIATNDNVEDDAAAGTSVVTELDVGSADVLVGIAASGRTPYTIAAVDAARARGALTIALVCTDPSPLAASAAFAIHPVIAAELVAGSTRLAAGSATKTVLDILTTGAMVRLGHIHMDRMIDVQAGNAKLRERAIRIVADLTERTDAEAQSALEAVGWSARAAIVHLSLGLEPAVALAHAAAHRFLSDALASPPTAALAGPGREDG
jgi:N-acetylmuramic acid 6-phosphate etherase